mmetsp:Transcript_1858/g.2944  ORF Transcript_1858/g.2944 Transcript_1858/m.2944 type:complete len:203 (+) Transcript_1858:284-892(+)
MLIVTVFTLPLPTTSFTRDMSSSWVVMSCPPSCSADCISCASSSTEPKSAPVWRSASTTPSSDTIRAVSANAFRSKDWMYCFRVVLRPGAPLARSDPDAFTSYMLASYVSAKFAFALTPSPKPPISMPCTLISASSSESIADAELNIASSASADSIGFRGSVPAARSRLKRLSALRRKYPNMMEAAYICAAWSLDMRTRELL